MKVTITGGSGFIGSHVADFFHAHGFDVVILDNLSTGNRANLSIPCTFIPADINNPDAVDTAIEGADYVIHLAAFLSVPESFLRFADCYKINVDGTYQILQSCVKHRIKRVVFASSSAVYASAPEKPKPETECPQPLSPYGVSKLEGEHLLNLFAQHHELPWTALRFFNVYGPRQPPNSDYAAVIPIFINNALKGKSLKIYGDGEQTRDFVWVKDVAKAVFLGATTSAPSGIYNVGCGTSITVNQLAEAIIAQSSLPVKKEYAPPRAGDVRSSTADIRKISGILGWEAKVSVAEGIKMTYDWYRELAIPLTNKQ